MALTSIYTYAILEVEQATYDEIFEKLSKAGYTHAFHDNNGDGKIVIDMHGIALAKTQKSKVDE
jgi:uncharacterized protein (DUF2141 family)